MVWGYEVLLNMNDGDGKDGVSFHSSGREENQQPSKKVNKSGADEFARAIARIAVAQVCEGLGFQSFHQSALETLTDVAIRYVEEIGKNAVSHGNSSNRSKCNVFDVIRGLEDVCSVQGFPGASDARPSVLGSGVVKDVMHYVRKEEEIPFAYLIPDFPVVKKRRANLSFAQAEMGTPDEHIPDWLPMFPTTWGGLDKVSSENGVLSKVHPVEIQDKNVEKHLLDSNQRTVCNGSEVDVSVEQRDTAKGQSQRNPFLAPPLQFGEKMISLPTLPAKILDMNGRCQQNHDDALGNHVSHFQPVMPAQDAAGGSLHENEDNGNSFSRGRPNVQFKFGNRKKCLDLTMSPPNKSFEKISVWFGEDQDGKELKKSNDEMCVDKMECTQEETQM